MPLATSLKFYHGLDAVERDSAVALNRAAQPSMFDRLGWFRLAERHSLNGRPLIIKASKAQVSAWLFLDRQGPRAEALSNWYCLRFGPVTYGQADTRPPISELVDGLREAGVSHLSIDPLGEDDPLPVALRSKGWLIRFDPIKVSWRIDTKGMSFDDYWAGRPSRLRNTAKRKARRAELDFAFYDRFDEDAWAELEQVFDASWKIPEDSPALIRDIARHEGDAGTLRLGLAYKDGVAVAAQIWTVEHGIATIHKLAYREDSKDLSAGTILSVEMFRRALDIDRVELIDFGIGDDGYKREWMTYSVPLYALSAYYPYSWAGLAGLAIAAGRKIVRRTDTSKDRANGRTSRQR